MLRFLTAGESHGKCLIGILEGLPAGLPVDIEFINQQLRRRQLGHGRGGRMKIEQDRIEVTSGVRFGHTIGSPISFTIENKDWDHWRIPMSSVAVPEGPGLRHVTRPRPGHADLPGALKYQTHDARDVLERASARETAARVAAGAFCRLFLSRFDIRIASHVIAIGSERVGDDSLYLPAEKIFALDPESPVRCADPAAEQRMISLVDEHRKSGDSLGGSVEVIAVSVPPGLGSHIQWDRRLDGLIAQAMMSIQSAKGVEIGNALHAARNPGSMVHDEIFYDESRRRFFRKTNRIGGIEGGISNGEEIRVRVHFKPIPTLLRRPLRSVDITTKEPFEAVVERSDTCVVPAAGVIAEAVLGIVIATVFLEKFGGDSMQETEAAYSNWKTLLDRF